MKPFGYGIGLCCALGLSFLFLAQTVVAQSSQHSEAINWFNQGVAEKDPQQKIAAYSKAVEIDPRFVEALYNLGLVYKKQGDYRLAEQYFSRAYNAKPDKIKNDTKVQILFELATTYQRLGKNKECEETWRRAKSLATNPALRATIALELGRLLAAQKQRDAALVELREGQALDPTKAGDFAELIQTLERERELERLYAAVEKAKAGGNWQQAKTLLEQILAQKPNDKKLQAQMAEVDSWLNAEAQKTTLAALYEQAQKHAAEGKLELAIAAYESLLQQAGSYKDAKVKLEAVRQQLEQKQFNEELESEYAAGLVALKERDWTRAILAFEKVLAIDRNFREARKRLAEAQSGLDRESTEIIVARYYAEGVSALNRNDWGGALAALEKVRKINPNYRDVTTLLAEVEKALAPQSHALTTTLPAPAAPMNPDSLYRNALMALETKDWMQAIVMLERLQLLQPNYRDVPELLASARLNLTAKAERVVAPQAGSNQTLWIGGALVAIVILPLLGLIAFSPATRAKIHCLRGNYAAAALLYESVLARHPDKVKFYLALANLYLLLGRRDEAALKIFKTILLLNLATKNRDEISTIVAQSYLTEGRTDSDAIAVLEGALQAERRKQGQK